MRVKSVVPPPTSQTSTRSPTRTRRRQRSPCVGDPRVERGLRLLEQRHVRRARPLLPRARSARAPPRRTTRARSAARPGPRGAPPDCVRSRRPAGERGRRPMRPRARPSAPPPAPPTAGSRRVRLAAPCDSHDLADDDEAHRVLRTALARQLADDALRRRRSHGSAEAAGREIHFARQVQERRQQRARRDLVRVDQLRDLAHLDRRLLLGWIGAHGGERTVGRAEIDPDDEAGCHGVGLSGYFRRLPLRRERRFAARPGRRARAAGRAMTATRDGAGRRGTVRLPTTRPTSLIDAGSNPLGTVIACSSAPSRIGSSSNALDERAPAVRVDVPHGCADLGVGVRAEVFHQKVHEAPLPLEDGQAGARRRHPAVPPALA